MLRSAVVWITFHCNYDCPYCITKNRAEKHPHTSPPEKWLAAFAALPCPITIDFTGGEPLSYAGFDHLIENLDPRHRVAVTSNMSLMNPDSPFWRRFVSITASYHPTQLDQAGRDIFWHKLAALHGVNGSLTVNVVGARQNMIYLDEARAKCGEIGVNFHLDPQAGINPGYTDQEWSNLDKFYKKDRFVGNPTESKLFDQPRYCSAGQSYFQVFPEGEIYPCFYFWRLPIGNFFNGLPALAHPLYCDTSGCAGCDYDGTDFYAIDGTKIKGGK